MSRVTREAQRRRITAGWYRVEKDAHQPGTNLYASASNVIDELRRLSFAEFSSETFPQDDGRRQAFPLGW